MSTKNKRAPRKFVFVYCDCVKKPWLQCGSVVKVPYQAPLNKCSQHLWYLFEEIVVLSLFDDKLKEIIKYYL